jgi:hypothetical protein
VLPNPLGLFLGLLEALLDRLARQPKPRQGALPMAEVLPLHPRRPSGSPTRRPPATTSA